MKKRIRMVNWNRTLVEETIEVLEDSNAKTQDAIARLRDFLKVNPGGPCVEAVGASDDILRRESPFQTFIERWIREQEWEKEHAILRKYTNREIQCVWDSWDGVELMKIDEYVINENVFHAEMVKRGLETGI